METSEMSLTSENLEKDVTLASEPAVAETPVENEPEAVAQPAVEEVVNSEPEVCPKVNYHEMDKNQLVEALKTLAEQPIEQVRDAVAQVKSAFYAIRNKELAEEKEAFLSAGNEEAAFAPKPDEAEATIDAFLSIIKEKRAEFMAAKEAEKEENLAKKRAIIDEINKISEDTDNVNRQYGRVQQLQLDFRAIGEVPAANETEMWKAYQVAVEHFYDMLKLNKELRDYDFKKNLEQKQQLCAQAEALDDVADILSAYKQLQSLHDAWREIGPVSKDLREELWVRFKNASSVIRKKHQAFFEERKAVEKENADAKIALCERIEAISTEGLASYAAWDEVTKTIIGLQDEWKKVGFASKKVNNDLFARFRKSCDEFFAAKAAFFAAKAEQSKQLREEFAANLAKKTALCEQAEALQSSTDWRKTTDALVALQKEWKTIGPVAKKHSETVWKRFIAACDAFFEEKKKQTSSARSVEYDNLKAKKEVIAQIQAVLEENNPDEGPAKVRELMKQWQGIGHVPFKEKDKIYSEYKAEIDKAFEQFDMKATRARMANFAENLSKMSDSDKVYRERERMVRAYEQKASELKTYENNLGFFSARSNAGNSLLKEMEHKIEKIKEDLAVLEQKIKLIDEKL